MSDAPTPAPAPPRPRAGAAYRRGFLSLLRMLYLAALIFIILWLSFSAFWYLIASLLLPPAPAPQVVDLPALTAEDLTRETRTFAGVRATENPREPLSHYHRFGAWFEPDRFNDCTRSGCHGALPHYRRKESRAFLNMHATSLHCGVCHFVNDGARLDLTWYDLDTGRAADAPASLRALAWLEDAAGKVKQQGEAAAFTRAQQREIVGLLRRADAATGAQNFAAIAGHLGAVRAESPDFRDLILAARDVVAAHQRGEYGSKLAVRSSDGVPLLAHPGGEPAAREFLAWGGAVSGAERTALLDRVHTRRAATTRKCTDCHRPEGSMIDFAGLGYPPARIEALTRSLLMQAIERIMNGEPLYLPGFVAPPDAGQGP